MTKPVINKTSQWCCRKMKNEVKNNVRHNDGLLLIGLKIHSDIVKLNCILL